MSDLTTVSSSTYYFTTAAAIQAAVKFTLQWGDNGKKKYVQVDLYNDDPSTTQPVATSLNSLATQDLVNLSANASTPGQVSINGGFSLYGFGVTFFGVLTSPFKTVEMDGVIGLFHGGGPEISEAFKFGDHLNFPRNQHTSNIALVWNEELENFEAQWSFNGLSGAVPLNDGQGTIQYNKNGININGTFSKDLAYSFTGTIILPDTIQLGYKDAVYGGYLGPGYNIR